MLKLRFIPNNVRIAIKSSVLLNIFILLSGLMLGIIGIAFGNMYYSKTDKEHELLREFNAENLSEFAHSFAYYGIILAAVMIAFLPKKYLRKINSI